MKIVSWNIRAGGGKRAVGIVDQLLAWQPDIIALSEFRATEASVWIAQQLHSHGYIYQRTTADPKEAAVNALLVASRWPVRKVNLKHAPANKRRWLQVNVYAQQTIGLMAMHIPNRSTGRKYPFMDSVTDVVRQWRGKPSVLLGDTNSGCIGIDEESPAFNKIEDQWIKTLNRLRWADAHRLLHGESLAYTWYSPNGRNGFRLDQAFIHPALHAGLREFSYIWGGQPHARQDCLSDHAAMVIDIDC